EGALQLSREVPLRARPTAEQIEAEGAVLRERVASKMGLTEQADAGHAAGWGEAVPRGGRHGAERKVVDQRGKQRLERGEARERRGVAPERLDHPPSDGHAVRPARRRTPGRISPGAAPASRI